MMNGTTQKDDVSSMCLLLDINDAHALPHTGLYNRGRGEGGPAVTLLQNHQGDWTPLEEGCRDFDWLVWSLP